jgi:hypothetical protein
MNANVHLGGKPLANDLRYAMRENHVRSHFRNGGGK